MSCLSRSRFINCMSLVFVALVACLPAMAQVVVSTNFEDGQTDGWIPRGTGTAQTVSANQANTGTQSLLTTGRTQSFGGPSIDLSTALTRGQLYIFTIYVRMAEGEANDSLKMTMQSTINGSNTFNTVASASTVTNGAWVKMVGAFTPAGSATALLLYIEGARATSSYYVDDFTVAASNGGCTNPPDNSGFTSDFEDSTTQGWVGRGAAQVANTTADAHTGTHSLIVTNRAASFNGPTLDITGKMCNGSQYAVIFWVKMAPGQPQTTIRVSLQLTLGGNQSFKTLIGNAPVTASSWVRFKVKPYTFAGAYDNLQIYVESAETAAPFASFYIDDGSLQFMPPPVIENIPSIGQAYAPDFLVGFATLQQDLLGPHGQLAALHYTSVTPGNDLKWDTTEPTEGNFNFTPGDNILTFAQSHNIKMRGHTFVWHNQVPAWVFQNNGVDMSTQPFSDANKQLLLSRLKNHINALINHYQGNIYVWDVVNEAIDESQANGFRRSKWYMITVDPNNNPGYPEYMDDAFIYARQALDALGIDRTQVKLCYNDFNTTIGAKRTFIYNWVQGAISRGVPIDCVGHQFHNTINFPIDDQGSAASKQNVVDTLNLFAGLTSTAGVPIIDEVTEFDISLYRFGQCSQTFYRDYDDLLAGDTTDLINQGYRYRDYFQIFKNLKNEIDSVTIWGLGDDDSWLNPSSGKAGCGVTAADAPLPFDSYLQHKYAYTGMMNPLALPGANLVTTVADTPSTVLSGHSVSYVITVTNNGPNDAASLTLSDTLPAATVFQSLAAPSGWTCTAPSVGGTGQVSCTASALTNGSSAQFTLTVMVVCATPNGTAISNTESATSTTLNPNPTPQNSASVGITVSDPPPVISAIGVSNPVLGPPNGKLVPETLSYSVTATCDANPQLSLSVTSNQPVNGDGTAPDWVVIDPFHVQLRAERSEFTRIYTLTVSATDSAGASSNASVNVQVPLGH